VQFSIQIDGIRETLRLRVLRDFGLCAGVNDSLQTLRGSEAAHTHSCKQRKRLILEQKIVEGRGVDEAIRPVCLQAERRDTGSIQGKLHY